MSEIKYLEKTFAAHLDSLTAILIWLRSYSSITGLSDAAWNQVEIAIEEACVNIINHAYAKKEGWIFFSCTITPHKKIECVIKDTGEPFDPQKKVVKVPKNTSLEALPIGGLGLVLMKGYMDEIRYEREGSYNVLTLIKFCS